jgi:hypothetical protein
MSAAVASFPAEQDVIDVNDDANDDANDGSGDNNGGNEWQSLFHVPKEAVEGIIVVARMKKVKRKKILPCWNSWGKGDRSIPGKISS